MKVTAEPQTTSMSSPPQNGPSELNFQVRNFLGTRRSLSLSTGGHCVTW